MTKSDIFAAIVLGLCLLTLSEVALTAVCK